MDTKQLSRFSARHAHVAVIGLGYVGLPLAVSFAKAGYQVTGIDLDRRKVAAVNSGESYIEDVPSTTVQELVHNDHQQHDGRVSGYLHATSDFSILADCDAVSICVPTPLSKTGDPEMSYIAAATEEVARYLHPGMVIVLESTTYPGTTTEVVLPILMGHETRETRHETPTPSTDRSQLTISHSALTVGKDFFLAFSPERVDPGRTDWTTVNTPKVMGGVTPACLEMALAYYGQAIETLVPVSSPSTAEMVKLFENTFRMVNIGLANELLLMCDKLGIDAWEVLDAAATKPFGFMRFTPGPGLGGHCIPIDPHYLSWKLRTLHYNARFIDLASEVNTSMPRYWVARVQDQLNECGKALKGSKILVLGIAYKKDVSDMRESPSLDIIHLLEEKGAQVEYHDPHVSAFQHDGMEMVGVSDLDTALTMADCVIITTDHTAYHQIGLTDNVQLMVDTRGLLRSHSANIPRETGRLTKEAYDLMSQ